MGSSYVGGGSDAICVAEWSSDEISISFAIFMHNLNCVAYFWASDLKYIAWVGGEDIKVWVWLCVCVFYMCNWFAKLYNYNGQKHVPALQIL